MKKHVLILGGGFAGVQAAIDLQKSKRFEVTLVSDRDYLFLYPVSIWIPVHKKKFDDVKVPLEQIRKQFGFRVVQDRVTKIQASENRVICEGGIMEFDYLVIAMGAGKMKMKGGENVRSICGQPEQSMEIRRQLDALVERGSGRIAIGFGGNPKDVSAVRGGPAFELIFNIHNYLKKLKMRDRFELTFFAPMEKPGAKMGSGSLRMMEKMFASYEIRKHFGVKISEFSEDGVIFEGGEKMLADMVMFIAPGKGHPVMVDSGLPLNDAGFVKINDFGQVEGYQHLYAIGDAASIVGYDWIAKQGHLADIMGRNAAHNIITSEKGKGALRGYHRHLNILCVMDTGRGAAFVFRNHRRAFVIPMPLVGHWVKKAWGTYARLIKVSPFPRLPGL